VERRRYPRYETVGGAYAALGSAYSKIGKVKDFSAVGLAFTYLASSKDSGKGNMIDVFLMENAFHIHNLPCNVIYDVRLFDEECESSQLESRRCGVTFTCPSAGQVKQIHAFLQKYTW
jgi:hypothetical protein